MHAPPEEFPAGPGDAPIAGEDTTLESGGPAPVRVEDDPDELRQSVGLSHAKVAYLRSLAERVLDGSLDLDRLDQLPDEEVIAQLTAVRGIGP